MTIDDFVAMTRRIIAKDGFDNYLPTIVVPGRRHIAVLDAIPSGVEIETAAKEWLIRTVEPGEDYFLVFKLDLKQLKILARLDGEEQVRIATVVAD